MFYKSFCALEELLQFGRAFVLLFFINFFALKDVAFCNFLQFMSFCGL